MGRQRSIASISKAAAEPKPAQVSLRWESPQKLHIAVQAPAGERPKVLLAITEDGLSTAVGKGENSGRTLQHAAVVRQLRELGTVSNGQFEANVDVAAHPDWNPGEAQSCGAGAAAERENSGRGVAGLSGASDRSVAQWKC